MRRTAPSQRFTNFRRAASDRELVAEIADGSRSRGSGKPALYGKRSRAGLMARSSHDAHGAHFTQMHEEFSPRPAKDLIAGRRRAVAQLLEEKDHNDRKASCPRPTGRSISPRTYEAGPEWSVLTD